MASLVVVDSGIALATILQESFSGKATALLRAWQQNTQMAAPALFRYEVIAVIRKGHYQGRLTADEASQGCDILLSLPIEYYLDNALLIRAYELAVLYHRPTAYDAQYLAVAERLDCELWTADERLVHAISRDFKRIRWLGDFNP